MILTPANKKPRHYRRGELCPGTYDNKLPTFMVKFKV